MSDREAPRIRERDARTRLARLISPGMKVSATPLTCISSVYVLLSLICSGLGAFAQAPSDTSPGIAELARQADVDLHHQRPDLAEAEYKKILALDANNISALSNLGLADYLQGNFASAASEFRIALRLKPDLWNIAALCGISEAKTANNTDAAVHLDQAFNHVADPSLRLAVGKQLFSILFEAGELSRAAAVIDQLRRMDPSNVDVLYAAHQVYSLLADKAFLEMAQLDPNSARMYQLRGDQMAQIGNMEGAIEAYRLAIDRDPHLSGVHFALGEVLGISPNADERAEAENEYAKALADNPLDEKAECRLGDIEMQRSNSQAAARHYQRALQLQPEDPDANEGYGLVLLTENSSCEAIRYLSHAVQLDPTNATAYYHLSQASRKAGDLDGAKRNMEEFLKLKAQRENLKQSFHDLPLQAVRQANQGKEEQEAPKVAPQEAPGEHPKPNQ